MPARDFVVVYLKPIAAVIVIGFMAWYFSGILTYIVIATLLSLMGMPLVKRLNKIKIGKWMVPHGLSASITLVTILLVIAIFGLIIVPLVLKQANVIASIDVDALVNHYQYELDKLNELLVQYNVIGSDETMADYLQTQITELLDLTKFTSFFANLLSATGSVFMGIFIILFLTFYFLLEEDLVKKFFLILTPDDHIENTERVLHDSKILLVRYFHGVMLEIVIMMTLESVGLLVFGVPNALLIGFFGGLMNVIPYLGPLIGATLGILLVTLSELGVANYDSIFISILTVIAVFGGANLIDNFILQPQIYSRNVKAHPVEVFLVIIIGGKLAGIVGMILAIPTYTIIKVIAREFAQRMKLVKFLTSKM